MKIDHAIDLYEQHVLQAAQIQEQLAALPDDVRETAAAFWSDLRPSGLQAACPACGALSMARYARGSQRRWWYVLHCADVRQTHISQ